MYILMYPFIFTLLKPVKNILEFLNIYINENNLTLEGLYKNIFPTNKKRKIV